MALLDKTGIENGQTIIPSHVTNVYDALNSSGSFSVQATGSFSGSFTGVFHGIATTASFAISASHEIIKEVSSSHANFADSASIVTDASQPYITTFPSAITFESAVTASSTINAGPTTVASGLSSFAQGSGSKATGDYANAIGRGTRATGFAAHAQGLTSTAEGSYSHAEGRLTLASGSYSHAEGHLTTASGDYAHAGGHGTIANGTYQRVIGKFNIATTNALDSAAFIIGDGADANNRSNILFAGNNKIELNAAVTASGNISSSANMFADRAIFNRVTTPLISNTTTVQIDNNLSGSAVTTASFGHFIGDGSQLTNLPSSGGGSGILIASGSTSASADPGTGIVINHSGSTAFSVIGHVGTLFSVDDDLSGTLFTANDVSGLPILKADASGEVYLGKSPQSLYTTAVVSSTNAAESHSLCTLSTSSYDGAFFEYTATSASNARAGNIMSVWNGANIVFAETTTTDIGNTSDLTTEVIISGSTARLVAYGPNASYKIKTIIKAI
jgi:hypothetical protein